MFIDLPIKSGQWSSFTPLSEARSHPAVAAYEGKLYSFGGGAEQFKSLNLAEVYEPNTDAWKSLSPMPTERSGAAAVCMGDRLVVMGGGYKKPDGKFKFLTTVEIYFPKEDRWETGPDLLQPHDYPACAIVDGKVYIIGGHHPDATEGGPQTDPAFDFTERWDGASDSWEKVADLPTPRFAAAAVAVEGKLWVMGGVAASPEGFHEYDVIEVFDPSAGTWQRDALSLPWSCAGQGNVVLEGQLYCFGGFREPGGIGKSSAVFDLNQKTWSRLPDMPLDRAAMGVGTLNGRIYLVGGWRANRSVKDSIVGYTHD